MSGAKAAKAFSRAGWISARQTGSHFIMIKEGSAVTLSVPMHSELDRGTLRRLISIAGLTVDEFADLL
ncbi:MAG TPA: type II toxin-antitoxin system HicA family toxin [Methanotrichaceae archaeon]|nr:type II toxin-antitoxin system HicA family toxin [Methanotrichaceae archaeon]